jgi:integrase
MNRPSNIAIPYSLGESVALYFSICTQDTRDWRENERRFARLIIPALGAATPVAHISSNMLASLIEAKRREGHPAAARVMHIALNRYFKWCRAQGHVERSPMSDLPTPGQPKLRRRTLSDAELERFWVATFTDKHLGSFFRLMALTLQERSQVAAMRWTEINVPDRRWTISTGKGYERRTVPLSPAAIAEIQSIPRIAGCPYIFSTIKNNGTWTRPSGFSRPKQALDGVMKPDRAWQLQDLRSTASAFLMRAGVAPDVTLKLLGKKPFDLLFPVSDHDLESALMRWTAKFTRPPAAPCGTAAQCVHPLFNIDG